ncbi:sperm microtubule associated protein 2-like [Elgaria multicarinata webbii]|uniref:sperm microtubule associated protein 2-like n=1 Tax=Elgaria multicarinata webbii TaxID=159646 RepID=UPI002FCCD947
MDRTPPAAGCPGNRNKQARGELMRAAGRQPVYLHLERAGKVEEEEEEEHLHLLGCLLWPLAVSSRGFHQSERLRELAKPKEAKDVWNFSRKLVWGNQDMIWPLSSCTLMSRPSTRTLALAKPKTKCDENLQNRSLFLYSCGRESEIWHRPPRLYSIMPSKRILQLAEPRECSTTYLKQRPRTCPQWPVSLSALSCKASQHILSLAQPRSLHPCFTLPRESETHISRAALRATLTPRTQRLSQPIFKKHTLCYDNRFKEAPIREVSLAAQQAMASPRVAELAKAEMLPGNCSPDRPAEWPVSAAAKHAVATPRLEELAQPPARAPTNFVQFNPEAFTVKESAKKTTCSERIKQLAQPTQR